MIEAKPLDFREPLPLQKKKDKPEKPDTENQTLKQQVKELRDVEKKKLANTDLKNYVYGVPRAEEEDMEFEQKKRKWNLTEGNTYF